MRLLVALALIAFPFAVYFLADRVSPFVLVLTFAALALLRIAVVGNLSRRWLALAGLGVAAFAALAVGAGDLSVLKLYPVLINAAGAGFFLYTLRVQPCAIERLVRLTGGEVDEAGKRYVWWVTVLWAAFFIINGAVALWTATLGSTEIWALYNGALSYVAIAALFGAEYLFRIWYRSRV